MGIKYERLRRKQAQSRLERFALRYLERKRSAKQQLSATILQACWRGYAVRKMGDTSKVAQHKLETRRATKLQVTGAVSPA